MDIIELRLREDKAVVIKDLYNLDGKWLNKPLTKEDKDALCEELNIFDSNGRLAKWTTVKNRLKEQGYTIEEKTMRIEGKRTKVSIINKK